MTTKQIIAQQQEEARGKFDNYCFEEIFSDKGLAKFEAILDKAIASTAKAVVEGERTRINTLMAFNIPQKTVKKTEAYNDGLTSGWYAAKEFIRQALK